jgi:hypothetical protein
VKLIVKDLDYRYEFVQDNISIYITSKIIAWFLKQAITLLKN